MLHLFDLKGVAIRLHFAQLATSVIFQDLGGREDLLQLVQHLLKMFFVQLSWALLEHLEIFVDLF